MSMSEKTRGILFLIAGIACCAGVSYYKLKPATIEEMAEIFIEDTGSLNGDSNCTGSFRFPLPLSRAAYKNNVELMKLLIAKGAKIDERDKQESQLTPLLWACVQGNTEAAILLLSHGANPEMDDYAGKTALIISAMKGHEAMVDILLKKGAHINNSDDENMTALAWACRNGHIQIVETLLNYGAAVEQKDINQRTPLIWACLEGHWQIVDLLLNKGALINVEDKIGVTPLIAACINKNRDYAKKFILMGSDLSKLNQVYADKINSLIKKYQTN